MKKSYLAAEETCIEWGGTLATSDEAWTFLRQPRQPQKFTCEKPSEKYVYKVSEEKLTLKQAEWACQAWQGTLWDNLSSMENQGEAHHVSQLLTAKSYWFGMQEKLG